MTRQEPILEQGKQSSLQLDRLLEVAASELGEILAYAIAGENAWVLPFDSEWFTYEWVDDSWVPYAEGFPPKSAVLTPHGIDALTQWNLEHTLHGSEDN